jgi:hypothetical protein
MLVEVEAEVEAEAEADLVHGDIGKVSQAGEPADRRLKLACLFELVALYRSSGGPSRRGGQRGCR